MKNLEKATKQSSLTHKKIRKAGFVHVEDENSTNFIYKVIPRIIRKFILSQDSKRWINSKIQKQRFWINKIKWKILFQEISISFVNLFIEGLLANFATNVLFDIPFTISYSIAHGIVIIQGLSIIKRLKKNDPNTKIHNKSR